VILITFLESILSVVQMLEAGRPIIYGNVSTALLLLYGRERVKWRRTNEGEQPLGGPGGSAIGASGTELDAWPAEECYRKPIDGYDPGLRTRWAHEWLGSRRATTLCRVGNAAPTVPLLIFINKSLTMIITEKQKLTFERYSQ
jgi:hypothetical protein